MRCNGVKWSAMRCNLKSNQNPNFITSRCYLTLNSIGVYFAGDIAQIIDIYTYISHMSKIEVTKVCEFCGKKFTAHKMTTRFCSHQCSQRNYKTEKREQKLEKVLEGENLPSPSPTTDLLHFWWICLTELSSMQDWHQDMLRERAENYILVIMTTVWDIGKKMDRKAFIICFVCRRWIWCEFPYLEILYQVYASLQLQHYE